MPGDQHLPGASPKQQRAEHGETKSSMTVEFMPGPLTSQLTRTAAEKALTQHPAIRKGASYALEQMDGRWVAAIVHSAPPPFAGGGPADSDEESPAPKSEGPDDTEPSIDDAGPPSDEGPPKEKDKGDKKGEAGELQQVLDVLTSIAEALGVPIGLGDSMVPGADDLGPGGPPGGPPPPPHGGPPGIGGPPEVDKTVHQRALKPGETPPGGTPIGAPAFASVRADHPWAHVAGKVASFEVSDQIGANKLSAVKGELDSLAGEIGYRVARFREAQDDKGHRVAHAVISTH